MGDLTKLYPEACNKIHFPKQHAFKDRRDDKYTGLFTHLNKKYPLKAWKGTWQVN